ncbi:MAG: riboflavin synthase [Planctomycetota bacterium]|nr:riboflavin synthase [Planctomycetota bacterium]
MFTGLIQHIGSVTAVSHAAAGGARLSLDLGPLAAHSKPGDSIAIDGCCLTLASLAGTVATFDAVPETLQRTTLGELRAGARVNLECALLPHDRLGGHFVQGHIDATAVVTDTVEGGRWAEWHLKLDDLRFAEQIVEKGSIAVDGISLTVAGCDPREGTFWVALIPETLSRTTIAGKKKGARVNVETDILGKYVLAALKARSGPAPQTTFGLDEARLREHGY